MHIVETRDAFEALLRVMSEQPSILIPIRSDAHVHPSQNRLCVLGVRTQDGETYGLPFNHSEAENLPRSWLNELGYSHYASDLNDVLYDTQALYDIQALEYLVSGSITGPEPFIPLLIRQFQGKYYNHRHINRTVPLVKWMEFAQAYGAHLSGVLQAQSNSLSQVPGYDFLTHTGIPVLHEIEQAGLHIDPARFSQHFANHTSCIQQNNLVYSQYNLYTATGRPSCKFGGINYASLNKHDGSRTAFTSRFPNGHMVLLDFESYHLRLIARLINYQLPDMPAHEFFGKQYFQTDTLTPEQYDESKRKSFYALYSDAPADLPFFQKVTEYKKTLWAGIQQYEYLKAPNRYIRLKHIEEPSPAKVFNYLIQWLETERNLRALRKVLDRFKTATSKVVLYNYDAILIDFSLDDGSELIRDTIDILERFDGPERFPVRLYYGPNYGEMKRGYLKV